MDRIVSMVNAKNALATIGWAIDAQEPENFRQKISTTKIPILTCEYIECKLIFIKIRNYSHRIFLLQMP